MDKKVFGVGELNGYVKNLLDSDDILASVCVRGEISNYKIHPSGHHYFTMKDPEGALRCAMFKSSAAKLRFKPENGMSVLAFGRAEIYQRDGAYQLKVTELTLDGVGDLHVAFEQLKDKLYKEGLFDERHKKPLPRYPGTIAVITSSAGAAVRDIIRVLRTRWPLTKVVIMPVHVQGASAPPEIVGAIKYANRHQVADVIIAGRGGGSIEDLWAFNDERVARAIFESEIPVISAVGHEPDFTIADFVADVRAATPSNAAERAVPDIADIRETIYTKRSHMSQALTRELKMKRQWLDNLASKRVLQDPKNYLDDRRIMLDHLHDRLVSATRGRLSTECERYARLAASLDAMSPLKVLGRGYAIARKADGAVVKKAADVKPGDRITVRLKKEEIGCVVE